MGGENIKHYCGIFGIYNHANAANMTYLGLFSLQHRGEEAAGICTSDGKKLYLHKGRGHVGEVFSEETFSKLPGSNAIGHTRYSTTGSSSLVNAQPYRVKYSRGEVAVAHNGNLVNAQILRAQFEADGSIFGSTMDSEIFIHLMAKSAFKKPGEALVDAVKRVEGAYSLVVLTETQLMVVRDPYGFRPLCLGQIGESYVVASETCAFDLINAKYLRDIEPGEVLVIDQDGLRSYYPFNGLKRDKAQCIFEHVYFARPDSRIFGENVGIVREKLGRHLAQEQPADADIVIPVPDSGNFAAMGYAKESGIPLAYGFVRNHYIGRTFINPTQSVREVQLKIKLNTIEEIIRGRRVVVVDDSIVRGNTSKSRVKLLRRAGAKEVHMRISCPPHISPCFYGIDFPSKAELLACNKTQQEMIQFLDVDSIGYLSLEGMLSATCCPKDFCHACFSEKYPTPIYDDLDKFKLENRN